MKITLTQCAGGGHTHINVEDDKETRTITVNTDELFTVPVTDEKIVEDVKAVIEKVGAANFNEAKAAVEAEFDTIEVTP
jgi:hypothetical protein